HQNTNKKLDLKSSKLANFGLSSGVIQILLAYYVIFVSIYNADFKDLTLLVGRKAEQKIKENLFDISSDNFFF
ncbi:hypothetical protein LZB72_09510, partial [Campylobacter jejuni]|nr:hypothetical protein [Campylobacter jejuni]